MATPSDVVKQLKDEGVEIVDVRFCDLPGLMQHFSIPAHELSEDVFDEGLGFDGSSIRGFQEIQESDMLLKPDPNTAVIDPFTKHKTLNINCFVEDPVTGESYTRDPRYIAKKAEDYLRGTGIADTAYFGPEAEFYIFDSAVYDQNQYSGYYYLDSIEGAWNSGRETELDGSPNLGSKIRYKEGYFPTPPMDQYQDLRSEMLLTLEKVGIEVEVQHHEVGTAGQAEIDMRFDTLATMADKLMLYKYVIKNVAHAVRARASPSCRSRSSRTTVPVCTCTSRSGRAASRSSSTRRATRACPTLLAGTSAGCSRMRRRSSRSRTPRRTRTSGSCRVTRRR